LNNSLAIGGIRLRFWGEPQESSHRDHHSYRLNQIKEMVWVRNPSGKPSVALSSPDAVKMMRNTWIKPDDGPSSRPISQRFPNPPFQEKGTISKNGTVTVLFSLSRVKRIYEHEE
jgi:hypothetical protein